MAMHIKGDTEQDMDGPISPTRRDFLNLSALAAAGFALTDLFAAQPEARLPILMAELRNKLAPEGVIINQSQLNHPTRHLTYCKWQPPEDISALHALIDPEYFSNFVKHQCGLTSLALKLLKVAGRDGLNIILEGPTKKEDLYAERVVAVASTKIYPLQGDESRILEIAKERRERLLSAGSSEGSRVVALQEEMFLLSAQERIVAHAMDRKFSGNILRIDNQSAGDYFSQLDRKLIELSAMCDGQLSDKVVLDFVHWNEAAKEVYMHRRHDLIAAALSTIPLGGLALLLLQGSHSAYGTLPPGEEKLLYPIETALGTVPQLGVDTIEERHYGKLQAAMPPEIGRSFDVATSRGLRNFVDARCKAMRKNLIQKRPIDPNGA